MKRGTRPILVFITPSRMVRAEFSPALTSCIDTPRPPAVSLPESVRATLALGEKPTGEVWVMTHDVFTQKVTLNPAQIAGLSAEQIARALSFEVEPFSGIPVVESVVGFHRQSDGSFSVVETSRNEREAIHRAVQERGGRLAGLSHAERLPEGDAELWAWVEHFGSRLLSGEVRTIPPPAREPSPNRYFHTSIVLEIAALLLVFLLGHQISSERKTLEARNAEFTAATREMEAALRKSTELKAREAIVKKERAQFEAVANRTRSIRALLHAIASQRPDDVVIRGLEPDGPSSVIVSGLALDAGAVDALSMTLTKELHSAGWVAQTRSKTGKKALSSGGPWEFSLLLTHEEAARAQVGVLTSQNDR